MTSRAKRLRTRVEAFYEKWGIVIQTMVAAWLIAVSLFVGFVSYSLYSYRSYGDHLVRTQCHRSEEFSPQIADFYEAHHVLDAQTLKDYRATIPKHC